ncbi:MAG TPA: DUF1877 family protein [Micromonosporaceae bacterium]
MLGYHFVLTPDQQRRLLAAADAGDQDAVGEIVEEIEETDSYTDDLRVGTDKAWDAIHRCLSDGSLDPDGGVYPLSYAILGGRHLHDDYYVCYVSAAEVRDVAAALVGIDEPELRRRYDRIGEDYQQPRDDVDFQYTWENFVDVCAFYGRAAAAECAVIFTAT